MHSTRRAKRTYEKIRKKRENSTEAACVANKKVRAECMQEAQISLGTAQCLSVHRLLGDDGAAKCGERGR